MNPTKRSKVVKTVAIILIVAMILSFVVALISMIVAQNQPPMGGPMFY